jgi:hypothetical protein
MHKQTTITKENIHDIQKLVNEAEYDSIIVDIEDSIASFNGTRHDYKILSGNCIIQNANNIVVKNNSTLIALDNNRTVTGYGQSKSFLFSASEGIFLEKSKATLSQGTRGLFKGKSKGVLSKAFGSFKEDSVCELSKDSVIILNNNAKIIKAEGSVLECYGETSILDSNDSSILTLGSCNIAVDSRNKIIIFPKYGSYASLLTINGTNNIYRIEPTFKDKIEVDIKGSNNMSDESLEPIEFKTEAIYKIMGNKFNKSTGNSNNLTDVIRQTPTTNKEYND